MEPRYLRLNAGEESIDVPKDGILSRTLRDDMHVNVSLFAFDAGQGLTEHTSSMAAVIEVVRGEASITLGGDVVEAKPGDWIYMEPGLPHSLSAKSPFVMLLTLHKSPR